MGRRRKELAQTAFTVSLLTAAIVLPGLGSLASERTSLMAKAAASGEKPDVAHESTTPLARDPKVAVEEEYQMARRQGTVQSLEVFIARHPDDPLAQNARAALHLLSG